MAKADRGRVAHMHTTCFPGAILVPGYWLYVWKVTAGDRALLYVGRTGDSSTPNASSPYQRMGQHLGSAKNQNALRKYLKREDVDPTTCGRFELFSYGPLLPVLGADIAKADRMHHHRPRRDVVAALEKKLADGLASAGYQVMNTVASTKVADDALWLEVRGAFARHFPKLTKASAP